ncbi:hypothetical protein PENVUL_c061G07372 [Penicillium vulpinum]|uniref:Uncharacterized protein n=1 Tax=Penicillium vulpinum TaxID=29845 RepID=A0A1V6RE96_9EURO|nr:hypothetical protein PENVUL_c061G07372 [Penicillium vulpinum]
MSRRRISHSEMNESLAYPFMQTNGPNGRRLIRRVTWRSSTYKLMATLWVLAVLYIVWLVRDLFMPFTPSETDTPPASQDQN